MGINQTNSLKTAFWKFLVALLFSLCMAVFIPFMLLLFGTTFGIVTYANYSEQSVKHIEPIIASAPDLSKVQLPVGCKYLLLDKNYQLVKSNLNKKDLSIALDYAVTGKMDGLGNKQYLFVTRENEFVILQYYIGSKFTDEWLNKLLPSPEILLYILMGLNCIAVCIFLTTRFSKSLRLQLVPLFNATKEVSRQNLDFEVGHSKIKEFEDVLLSFSNMKDSLKNSLKQQWQTEQMQKEQIASLTHDLKTPLTIIQGNIDLLCETNLDDEQKMYSRYIIDGSKQMQEYIKILIEISRASTGYLLCKKTYDIEVFLGELQEHIKAICYVKKKQLVFESVGLPDQITIDKTLLERAVLNVVNNALDYSTQKVIVKIRFQKKNDTLEIIVIDDGKGFSKDALYHAKEQFYMEDKGRSSKMHFGMGLYIANCIAKCHGGKI